ncbi:noggin-2-like [Brienomyrus brachyistius]|uniref:noggin-2-like n=1 Tax=Brienomyrus brachyistius TaxID=42636 RepID=UPI0020B19899|nr:noggin-2-like [Brienomyrus brachyistius]
MSCFFAWLASIALLMCWTFPGFSSNQSIHAFSTSVHQHKLHSEGLQSQGALGTDLSFLRSRSQYVSSVLPVRPYSLSINADDYHYTPKPKHLRPARLLRILGSSFDPFWMSIERPANVGIWVSVGVTSESPSEETAFRDARASAVTNHVASSKGFNLSTSPELTEGAARYQRKLEMEAEELDLPSFTPEMAGSLRAWLVRTATCGLRYQWVDLGPVFWPRWLRHTDCEQSGTSQSCSFPSGMSCRQAQVTQIKILAWHCWGNEDRGSEVMGEADSGASLFGKRCVWRQVPYPVVTACKCSCK